MTTSTALDPHPAKPGPRTEHGKRRSASNSFKHGLYSSAVAYSSSSAEAEYNTILEDFENEFRPVLPSECVLVQQLAALQFRYLRVQTCYSNSLRQAMAQERANPKLPLPLEPDTEISLESRVFTHLFENVPSFRLYLHELDRLPNRIFRILDRLHSLRKNHPIGQDWNDSLLTLSVPSKSEETPQLQGTNPPPPAKPLDEKSFLKLWASTPRETRQSLLQNPSQPVKKMWLSTYGLDEATFQRWVRRHTLGA